MFTTSNLFAVNSPFQSTWIWALFFSLYPQWNNIAVSHIILKHSYIAFLLPFSYCLNSSFRCQRLVIIWLLIDQHITVLHLFLPQILLPLVQCMSHCSLTIYSLFFSRLWAGAICYSVFIPRQDRRPLLTRGKSGWWQCEKCQGISKWRKAIFRLGFKSVSSFSKTRRLERSSLTSARRILMLAGTSPRAAVLRPVWCAVWRECETSLLFVLYLSSSLISPTYSYTAHRHTPTPCCLSFLPRKWYLLLKIQVFVFGFVFSFSFWEAFCRRIKQN